MEAKDKAKELVEKFLKEFDKKNPFSPYDTYRVCERAKANDVNSKIAALICVDEIIYITPYESRVSETLNPNDELNMNTVKYWQEVKKEIEAL